MDWYQDWERGDTERGSAQEAWFGSSVTSGWCFSKGEPDGWPQQHHHPHGSLWACQFSGPTTDLLNPFLEGRDPGNCLNKPSGCSWNLLTCENTAFKHIAWPLWPYFPHLPPRESYLSQSTHLNYGNQVSLSKHLIMLSESCSVVSDSLWPHGLYSPWNSLGQNTGVGRLYLFQEIFPTQRLNPGLLHCRWILYQLSYEGMQRISTNYYHKEDVAHIVNGLLCLTTSFQSCPTLCGPMDCSPPSSSVHGVLQARILEWVATPSSQWAITQP